MADSGLPAALCGLPEFLRRMVPSVLRGRDPAPGAGAEAAPQAPCPNCGTRPVGPANYCHYCGTARGATVGPRGVPPRAARPEPPPNFPAPPPSFAAFMEQVLRRRPHFEKLRGTDEHHSWGTELHSRQHRAH